MKKAPQKSQIPRPKPFKIKVDPLKLKRQSLVLPKVTYNVVASTEMEEVFTGSVLPIPTVLIYYLTHTELLVAAVIMEETNEHGECLLTVSELATRIKTTNATISTALYSMRRFGLLLETPNGMRGNGRNRMLNYQAIQHLNDLVEGEDPGIYVRIRRAASKKSIPNINAEDIRNAYDNKVLPPDHDPAEEEEYD